MNKKRFFVAALFLCAASFVNAQMVGNDADKHGCKASAGQTYSTVLKECIQVFNQELKLESVNKQGAADFIGAVVFSVDKKKAEVFIKEAAPSIVLNRKGKEGSYTWVKGEYTLSQAFTLKKGDTEIYKSK